MEAFTAPDLTPASEALFLELARDAGNWGGTPLLDGNVSTDAASRGNLTDLKVKGLITTFRDEGCTWVDFTRAGKQLAASHGIAL